MELDSPPYNLPSSAGFIDRLINELASFQADLPSNTTTELDPPRTQSTHQPKLPQNALSRLSPSQLAKVKPLLLTLHCLFPNDLLPALDILDRRLVQRIVVRGDKTNAVPSASTPEDHQTVSSPRNDQETHHDQSDTRINQTTPDDTTEDTPNEDLFGFVFLVTSASSAPAYPIPAPPTTSSTTSTSTYTTNTQPQKVYEVRLNAWNCTCPTFTLSTFRDLDSRLHSISKPNHTPTVHPSPRFRFSSPPPSNTVMLRDQDDGSASASASVSAVYPFGGTLTCPTDRDSPPACKHILACVLFARCPRLFGGGGDDNDDDDRGVDVSMEELAGWCAGWGG